MINRLKVVKDLLLAKLDYLLSTITLLESNLTSIRTKLDSSFLEESYYESKNIESAVLTSLENESAIMKANIHLIEMLQAESCLRHAQNAQVVRQLDYMARQLEKTNQSLLLLQQQQERLTRENKKIKQRLREILQPNSWILHANSKIE
ncbi:hypothetical protein [Gloeobacter kilaueensis]|uniref:Uncharacterized protein n=1 Tax=Gloeobacter kilaueensis (strain ATCC BAA-2537 / CCAP 1431/1 / ULC 316 / JS1) TaxID=1183438 RepID=U5QNC5_GLOK1|nr:hypothetical protein [Gloeobacter kilaueensis]AGY60421.1 hypothetical protein GKIL_4175 [Gloeobacter kilaueensis JS1]